MPDMKSEQPQKKPDGRGYRPGVPMIPGPRGGMIGPNPPFIATDQMRQDVRTWTKVADMATIAAYMNISTKTLQRHFQRELTEGRFEMISNLGAKAINMAMKGDPTMLIFVLRTRGKWSSKPEYLGDDEEAAAINIKGVLSGKTDEELAILEPFLEQLLAAGSDDFDFRDKIGSRTAEGDEEGP